MRIPSAVVVYMVSAVRIPVVVMVHGRDLLMPVSWKNSRNDVGIDTSVAA